MSSVPGFEDGPQYYYDEDIDTNLVIVPAGEYEVISRAEAERRREYYRRERAIRLGGNTRYVNCYHEPVRDISARVELHVLGALIKLLPYMSFKYGNGILIRDGKRMGIDEVAKTIDKKSRASKDIVRQLKESGVLTTEKDGRRDVYGVSAEYHSIGIVRQDERYTKLYQTASRERLEKVSIQAAGLLYKMLPYFNYEHYFLCENPDEKDIDKINALTMRGLAKKIGEEHSTVVRYMRELSRAGFVMLSVAYGVDVIKVNPDVMYRKKYRDEEADRLSAEFGVHERKSSSLTWEEIGAELVGSECLR